MDALDIIPVVAGSLIANLLTGFFLFGVWRLGRNERDFTAMAIVLASCGLGALSFLALSQ